MISAASIRLFDRLLALFYPEICQVCQSARANSDESYICGTCRSGSEGIRPIDPPFCDRCGLPFSGEITGSFECGNCREHPLHFRRAKAAAEFTGLVRDVIIRYKYNHHVWFERFLAELLVQRAQPELSTEAWDFLVPIPLHWRKRRERSFNQALRLAGYLSRATGIPVNTRLLKRVQPTLTQTRLTRAERAENVRNAFTYRGPALLDGARIILIDDVLTTGATANACAKLLRQNGAALVDVWTVARGILK